MMIQEFTERTGFRPSDEMYRVIEAFYYNFNGNKDEFCKAYKENTNGIAAAIRAEANSEAHRINEAQAKEIKERDTEIERLKKKIEQIENWRSYEVSRMSQEKYTNLRVLDDTRQMSDGEAKKFIADKFGFDERKIRIIREIPTYSISNNGRIKKTGTVERPPVYNATDWYYIRFDVACWVGGWQYEAVNGMIYQYED